MTVALRVASWNINSVRLRIDLLARLAADQRPDVICLQETKVEDAAFPHDAIAAMGYNHRLVWGMKSYNGVAILSRLPFDDQVLYRRCGRNDCRHIMARLSGIELHCLYIPAGGDVPDAALNDKFAHKLDFLREAAGFFASSASGALLAGDLNIAPLEHDVWSHKQLLTVVSHTPAEVALLDAMQTSGNFIDAVRHFVPPAQKLYSWWSYRARDWAASDRGRRLDHIWLTADLAPRLRAARILRDMRGWEKASDHVPVLVDLA